MVKIKLLSFFLLCGLACTAFGSGLVVEYKFDGSLMDSGSDGNTTNTLTAAADPAYTQGLSGEALYCNSNTFTAADSNDLDLASQYTIEAFIKPYLLSGIQYILSKSSYKMGISDGNLGVYHTQSDGTVVGGFSVPLTLNRWQHIAVTADGSTITLYLNGKAASSFLYNGTILNSTASLSIGSISGSNQYNGIIDEVRMFGAVKTASYIYSRALYSCGDLPQEDIDSDCRITVEDFYIAAEQWLLCDGDTRTDCY